ncbi:MAG: chemotaxis protein CheW [Planctomycetota bacterium]
MSENQESAIMDSQSEEENGERQAALAELAGKYLTFCLGKEEYGLEILKVREIIGMMDVTTVPRTPDFIRGVINLRGKVIPVVEIREKFDLGSVDDTEKTCIIVVQVGNGNTEVTMGIIVDEVSEVLDIGADQLEPSPEFGTSINTDFILAMGRVDEKLIMLLDIDRVLSSGELQALDDVGGEVSAQEE